MKFISRHGAWQTIVRPAYYEVIDGVRVTHKGLRAEFSNYQFDTATVRSPRPQWTDEEARKMVEEHLLNHPEYGRTFKRLDEDAKFELDADTQLKCPHPSCDKTFASDNSREMHCRAVHKKSYDNLVDEYASAQADRMARQVANGQ